MADKKLYRSLSDKMISGVCGGIGAYFGIDPTVIRIAWVAIALLSVPAGLFIGGIAYLACWLIIPRNPDEMALVETRNLDDETPEPESDVQSNSLAWGIVLILLALVVLTRTNLLPFGFHWGRGPIIPLLLLGAGIFLMFKYRPEMAEKLKSFSGQRRLYRSATDKKIFGVCGGLADSFHIDPTLVRLGWALLTLMTGVPVIIYLLLAFILPVGRPDSAQSPVE